MPAGRCETMRLNAGGFGREPGKTARLPCLLEITDFERGDTWLERLAAAGFDAKRPAVVSSMGVSMYRSRDAVASMLRDVASLAAGSTLVMSFMLPIELAEPEMRKSIESAARGARANGTPWGASSGPI